MENLGLDSFSGYQKPMNDKNYITQNGLKKYRDDNKPKECPILGHEEYTPVVDHDHRSGRIRGIISSEGNALIGKIENFYYSRCVISHHDLSKVLRAIAEYLETPQGPYHPLGTRQITKRFGKFNKDKQVEILLGLGVEKILIEACVNSKERTILFREAIIK